MKHGYKTVIKQCLPKADIVADRFHVETLAKRMVDEIRAVVQDECVGRKRAIKENLTY